MNANYCPNCSGRWQKQPILSGMVIVDLAPSEQEPITNKHVSIVCQRCKYTEIIDVECELEPPPPENEEEGNQSDFI